MYHGLRKVLTTGVGRSSKDERVAKVDDSFTRLHKGLLSLQWAIDNCEATWSAQSSFCKYLPAIAADTYARDDTAARTAIAAAKDAVAGLTTSNAAAHLAPVKSELSTLLGRMKKLDQRKTEWTRTISDKAYYDDRHAKVVAALEKTGAPPTARETDRLKRALSKKTQAAKDVERLSALLHGEFQEVAAERLHLADRVFLAVLATQSANARRADLSSVHALLVNSRFGAREIPVPARDHALRATLTGVDPPQRVSTSSSDHSPPPPHYSQCSEAPNNSPPQLNEYHVHTSSPPPPRPPAVGLPAPPPVVSGPMCAPPPPDGSAQYSNVHAHVWQQHFQGGAQSGVNCPPVGVSNPAIDTHAQHVPTGFSPSAPPPPSSALDPLFQSFDTGGGDIEFFPRS